MGNKVKDLLGIKKDTEPGLEEKVIRIKEELFLGNSVREVSELFRVSKSCVYGIRCGRTWKHVELEEK